MLKTRPSFLLLTLNIGRRPHPDLSRQLPQHRCRIAEILLVGAYDARNRVTCVNLSSYLLQVSSEVFNLLLLSLTTVDEHRLGEELVADGSAGRARRSRR